MKNTSTHSLECTFRKCLFHRRCSGALFSFFSERACSHRGISASSHYYKFASNKRESVQNSYTFLWMTWSSQSVPTGKWRRGFLGPRRNEIIFARPRCLIPVWMYTDDEKYTNVNAHGNIHRCARMKNTSYRQEAGFILWSWCNLYTPHPLPNSKEWISIETFHGSVWLWHCHVPEKIFLLCFEKHLCWMLLWWWW